MTKENIEKLYKHFCETADGKVKTGNPVRDELIKSDAKRNKEKLEKKFPYLVQEQPKEEAPAKKEKVK